MSRADPFSETVHLTPCQNYNLTVIFDKCNTRSKLGRVRNDKVKLGSDLQRFEKNFGELSFWQDTLSKAWN